MSEKNSAVIRQDRAGPVHQQKEGELFRHPAGYLDSALREILVADPRVAGRVEGNGIAPANGTGIVNGTVDP